MIALSSALAATSACQFPATELEVALDTDVPRDRQLTIQIEARAVATAASGLVAPRTDAGPTPFVLRHGGDAGAVLPASFALTPARTDATRDGRLELRVVATVPAGPGGAPPPMYISRVLRVAFVPRVHARLPLFLAAACGVPTTGCRDSYPEGCTVSRLCEERALTCERGRCVRPEEPSSSGDAGGSEVECLANAACGAGRACVTGRCVACDCPASAVACQVMQCADDGSGRCVAQTAPDGAPCDDGVACTYDDRCSAGACRGTALTCVDDACVQRACDGTARCAETPLGVPVYESTTPHGVYVYTPGAAAGADGGAPVFRLPPGGAVVMHQLSLVHNGVETDAMVDPLLQEPSDTSWCGRLWDCIYRANPARANLVLAPSAAAGMVMLQRWVAPHGGPTGDILHRAAVASPGAGWQSDAPLGGVCPAGVSTAP